MVRVADGTPTYRLIDSNVPHVSPKTPRTSERPERTEANVINCPGSADVATMEFRHRVREARDECDSAE